MNIGFACCVESLNGDCRYLIRSKRVPGYENVIADRLSRVQIAEAKQTAP